MSNRPGDSEARSRLNRRRFMQGAAVSLITPLLSGWAPRGASPESLEYASAAAQRIGVLLPASRVYPALAESLLAGLRLGGMQAEREIAWLPVDTGLAPGAAVTAARQLIEEDGVDGLIGVVHGEIAARIEPLCAKALKPLWVCSVGASAAGPASPWITHHTLLYWQAQWLLGDWAARNLGKRVAMIASLYDSGYDALYAFRVGFEAAGGQVLQTCVTHLSPEHDDLTAALDTVAKLQPDFVHAQYCGPAASEFMAAYAQHPTLARIPLTATPFMTGSEAPVGMISCLPWAGDAGLAGAEQTRFAEGLRSLTDREADPFSVLGYDVARLAAGGSQLAARSSSPLKMTSPRGMLRLDPVTRQTFSTLYVRQVHRVGGTWRNVVVGEIELPPDLDQRLAAARSGPVSGWTNTYLGV